MLVYLGPSVADVDVVPAVITMEVAGWRPVFMTAPTTSESSTLGNTISATTVHVGLGREGTLGLACSQIRSNLGRTIARLDVTPSSLKLSRGISCTVFA